MVRHSTWCSIIIPTLSDSPMVLNALPSSDKLSQDNVEVIVVRDRGWRNASRTRNIGAAVARGKLLCFIDDDASLNSGKLLSLINNVGVRENAFVWHDPPHLLIIHSDAFYSVGGYDERFNPTMGETIELRLKLLRSGYVEIQFNPQTIELIHLKEHPDPRYLLNQKHLTWAYLEHNKLPIHRLVWRKNPKELLRRLKWIIEWKLIRKHQRRSIFSR